MSISSFASFADLSLTRSGRSDAHQALDACVEEVNSDLKAWVAGERDSDMWRRLVRNFKKLKQLRCQVFFFPVHLHLHVLLLFWFKFVPVCVCVCVCVCVFVCQNENKCAA